MQQMSGAHGLILLFIGPDGGRRNDARMYHEHHIRDQITRAAALAEQLHPSHRGVQPYIVFADGAYPVFLHLFKGHINPRPSTSGGSTGSATRSVWASSTRSVRFVFCGSAV